MLTAAFGLRIASDLELPELRPIEQGRADIVIAAADLGFQSSEGASDEPAIELRADGVQLSFPGVARFRVTEDRICYQLGELGPSLVRLPLLGAVMAVLLQLRGHLVLHASAVLKDDAGMLFLGDKGAGKSTTAAALVCSGFRLLTDDIAAARPDASGCWRIESGYPQLKLTESAAAAVDLPQAVSVPVGHSAVAKLQRRLPFLPDDRAFSVGTAFVLVRGERLSVESLSPSQALVALLRYAYLMRYGELLFGGEAGRRRFQQCASFATRVAVKRLVIPEDLSGLHQIAALLEQEAG